MWTLVPTNTFYLAYSYLMANDKSTLTPLLIALVRVSLDLHLLAIKLYPGSPHIMYVLFGKGGGMNGL